MADVSIKVGTSADTASLGDVVSGLSRVEDALTKTSESAKQAAENTSRMEAIFREVAVKGLALMRDFAVQSVQSALENERAVTRLRRVAGEYTEALEAQADAIQQQLNVEAEAVMSLQEMALRFDVAPGKVDELTRAVLDYAKATGIDAEGAMRRLLIGLENGGAGLAKMGVQLQSTGNRAADLGEAVRQLHERWGGAAVADAQTLQGEVKALQLAFGELQEAVGKAALSLAVRAGAKTWMSELTDALNYYVSGEQEATEKAALRAEYAALATAALTQEKTVLKQLEDGQRVSTSLTREQAEALARSVEEQKAKVQGLQDWLDGVAKKRKEAGAGAALPVDADFGPGAPSKEQWTALKAAAKERGELAKKVAAGAKEEQEAGRQVMRDMADMAKTQQELDDEKLRAENESNLASIQASEELHRALEEGAAEEQRIQEENLSAQASRQLQHNADMQRMAQEQQRRVESAVMQGGQVLIQLAGNLMSGMRRAQENSARALTAINETYQKDLEEARRYSGEKSEQLGREALERLQKGMKAASKSAQFDPMSLLKEAIPALVQIALTAYAPTAPVAPLVASAVRLLMNSFHEGGWVGDDAPAAPRQRPAMLLEGERVLSHGEVRAMGGPSSVDALASGRGGGGGRVTLQVSTLDAGSFRDWMSAEGGTGLARAILGGQGETAQLLRRLKR